MANRIFAFTGPHAAGKTSMVTQLMSMGIHVIPVYCTRTFKDTDVKKKLYTTISREEFLKKEFIVRVSYKGDYYGIQKKDVMEALDKNKLSIIIMDINGIKQITKFVKQNFFSIYLMADYVALVDRMLRMGLHNDEIKYHLEYAETNNEFENWKTTNFVVKNTGKLNVALEQVLSIMGLMTLPSQEEFDQLIH